MPASKHKESIVRDLLNELLTSKGFKRIRANWRRETESTYQLANIQRSTYGPYFFLNFAIVYKVVEPDRVPYRAFGHLEFRAGDQMVHRRKGASTFKGDVHRHLDEDADISTEVRRKFINGILWQEVENIFDRFGHIDAAHKHASLPFQKRLVPMVNRELLEFFGIPSRDIEE